MGGLTLGYNTIFLSVMYILQSNTQYKRKRLLYYLPIQVLLTVLLKRV